MTETSRPISLTEPLQNVSFTNCFKLFNISGINTAKTNNIYITRKMLSVIKLRNMGNVWKYLKTTRHIISISIFSSKISRTYVLNIFIKTCHTAWDTPYRTRFTSKVHLIYNNKWGRIKKVKAPQDSKSIVLALIPH